MGALVRGIKLRSNDESANECSASENGVSEDV
jgi:hypothetical protein